MLKQRALPLALNMGMRLSDSVWWCNGRPNVCQSLPCPYSSSWSRPDPRAFWSSSSSSSQALQSLVVYEDDSILVLNKPAGINMHASPDAPSPATPATSPPTPSATTAVASSAEKTTLVDLVVAYLAAQNAVADSKNSDVCNATRQETSGSGWDVRLPKSPSACSGSRIRNSLSLLSTYREEAELRHQNQNPLQQHGTEESREDEEEKKQKKLLLARACTGVVHRLDRDTSGLVVLAKTNTAHALLAAQFQPPPPPPSSPLRSSSPSSSSAPAAIDDGGQQEEGGGGGGKQVKRAYWALVYGWVDVPPSGIFALPFSPSSPSPVSSSSPSSSPPCSSPPSSFFPSSCYPPLSPTSLLPPLFTGVCSTLIGRHPYKRHLRAVVEEGSSAVSNHTTTSRAAVIKGKTKQQTSSSTKATGQLAVTRYSLLRQFASGFALLRLSLDTGRTHQIRVHCAHLAYPLVFDPLYGPGPAEVTLQKKGEETPTSATPAAVITDKDFRAGAQRLSQHMEVVGIRDFLPWWGSSCTGGAAVSIDKSIWRTQPSGKEEESSEKRRQLNKQTACARWWERVHAKRGLEGKLKRVIKETGAELAQEMMLLHASSSSASSSLSSSATSMYLHAHSLSFLHPTSHQHLSFHTPDPPPPFCRLLSLLQQHDATVHRQLAALCEAHALPIPFAVTSAPPHVPASASASSASSFSSSAAAAEGEVA